MIDKQYVEGREQEKLKAVLSDIFLRKSRDEWLKLLDGADVCVGPVNSISEVFNDPQVIFRRMLTEIQHPVEGVIKQIKNPLKFSNCPLDIRTPPPLLGEHTEQILKRAGYSEENIREFRNQDII